MPDIDFLNYLDEVQDDIDDLVVGLSDNKQKRLNPKYFYDEKGSILFDQITEAIKTFLVEVVVPITRNELTPNEYELMVA